MVEPFITHYTTLPANLKTAEEIGPELHVEASRLREFADARLCPHFRVDGGPPLFQAKEMREWVGANLLQHLPQEGSVQVRVLKLPPPATSPRPTCLSAIEGLRELEPMNNVAGVYFLCRGHELLYVGQSVSPSSRIAQHTDKDYDRAFFLPCPVSELDHLESSLIHLLEPPLNGRSGRGQGIAAAICAPIGKRAIESMGYHGAVKSLMREAGRSEP